MSTTIYNDLLVQYLDVCNAALERNRDRFPFKQILGAAQRAERGRLIELQIVEDEQSSYVMQIEQGRVVAQPHGDCKDCNCVREWNVSKDYLEDVVQNPQIYINNPAKINWEWMYDS